jgi:hypothetical protein
MVPEPAAAHPYPSSPNPPVIMQSITDLLVIMQSITEILVIMQLVTAGELA